MLDKAFRGGTGFWTLVACWLALITAGAWAFGLQLQEGLVLTGMSRDISWGFYIAQFTFLVGVAASAVMVVLPYHVHRLSDFRRLVIFSEFLAVASVVMCLLFILVDLGQPTRALNVILYPNPRSVMFWDMVALSGYLLLNLAIGWTNLEAERNGSQPPSWVRWAIYLSIPWALSIHTVTAFLYAGLEARSFWLTAILAPRFLASAFASGTAALILIALALRRLAHHEIGEAPLNRLAIFCAYALAANLFFFGAEAFTLLYANNPHHLEPFHHLFLARGGAQNLAPWAWTSLALAGCAFLALAAPWVRNRPIMLTLSCLAALASVWIEKGYLLIIAGFTPAPLGTVAAYTPTWIELVISAGIYGVGGLVLTLLYSMVLNIRARPVTLRNGDCPAIPSAGSVTRDRRSASTGFYGSA